jgi:hypothetical protein
MSAVGDPTDQRSNLEKLDDLQATHPFPYNLVVGLVVGIALFAIGVPPALVALYALLYAGLRWYLWQDGRILHRQYEARRVRWATRQAERRRQRG